MFANSITQKTKDIYGGSDPADLPRYSYVDAARATNVPSSTIGAWVRGISYALPDGGRGRYSPVITKPSTHNTQLSFNNLLEVNVLRALRQVHDVRLQSVREAIERAKQDHNIERLLIHPDLRTSGGKLFLNYYFEIVELSNTQQLAMSKVLEHSLTRVDVHKNLHLQFFPIPRAPASPQESRPILVSPYVSFGNSVVGRRGVTTTVIRSRFDLGETRATIVEDYGLLEEEFDEAILYEAAA